MNPDDAVRFETDVGRPEGDELAPAEARSVLQWHCEGPGRFSIPGEGVEQRVALVVVWQVVPRDEAGGLPLVGSSGGVRDLPHRGNFTREPSSLVRVGDQRSQAGTETLEGCGRESLASGSQDLFAHRRRPLADGHVTEPRQDPVSEVRGLPLLVPDRASAEVHEVVACQGRHGPEPVGRGADLESCRRGRPPPRAPCCGRRTR